MVDLSDRLSQIKRMVDAGQYFTINRARQYGKTTILQALDAFLKTDYVVINIDFQLLSASKFRNENAFSIAFAKLEENREELELPEERTDLIIDYHGERFIVEIKLWHGTARHLQGEKQLSRYLSHYRLKQGNLLTFNFNRSKEIGVREVSFEDKVLIEATV